MDRLIVMNEVSGIGDGSHEFTEFLTVCRRSRYHCIYVFHITAPDTEFGKVFLQTTKKYVPVRSM